MRKWFVNIPSLPFKNPPSQGSHEKSLTLAHSSMKNYSTFTNQIPNKRLSGHLKTISNNWLATPPIYCQEFVWIFESSGINQFSGIGA
jgi:hypothetical protein